MLLHPHDCKILPRHADNVSDHLPIRLQTSVLCNRSQSVEHTVITQCPQVTHPWGNHEYTNTYRNTLENKLIEIQKLSCNRETDEITAHDAIDAYMGKLNCAIGSVRCIIIPIDGDCALGFRCIEFTSCSMADEQFATLICSQLKSELAHIAAKTPGRKCDLLQILYDDKIVSPRIQLPGNKLSGVHHVVYNPAVGVRNLFDVSLLTLLFPCCVLNTT